jgi:YD repeat-containing protein
MPTTLEQIQYGFDRDSRRTWQKRPLTTMQDQAYQYDALGQVSAAARGSLNSNLTAISGTPPLAQSWEYDPTGNWRGFHTSINGADTLDQHRVHDRGNRMTQIEGNPHNQILDRAGRMRQLAPDAEGDWEGKLELTWDAWSRITKVKNNGEVVGEYTYDGQHRRVTREVGEEAQLLQRPMATGGGTQRCGNDSEHELPVGITAPG